MGDAAVDGERDDGDARPAAIYVDEGALTADDFAAALARIEAERGGHNRFVVRVRTADALARLAAAPLSDLAIERLVPADLAGLPDTEGGICFDLDADGLGSAANPDVTERDMEAFGLLLSDAVLAPSAGMGQVLADAAQRLGKPLVAAEHLCDPVPMDADADADDTLAALRRLDPAHRSGWRGWRRRHIHGRLDTILTDLVAFGAKIVLRHQHRTVAARDHLARAGRAAFRRWKTDAYFAPSDWRDRCPSRTVEETGRLARQFEWLDRAALSGARQYRDLIWVMHGLAGIAVMVAIAGSFFPYPPPKGKHLDWGTLLTAAELVALLVIVAIVLQLYVTRQQHRWTACRVGAEQLRIARMCLPLLIAPSMLLTPDRLPSVASRGLDEPARRGWTRWLRRSGRRVDEAAVVVALVKRAVREAGPSALKPGTTVPAAAEWLRCIVSDQLDYHRKNHDRLHAVEQGVRIVNGVLFLLAVATVIGHLFHATPDCALLVTAGGPALAAALHGASGRLEIARRSDLSHAYARRLGEIDAELERFARDGGSWSALRTLGLEASEAMGSEADAWHATMLLEPVTLP